jgi:CRISP-associated protein Cas1
VRDALHDGKLLERCARDIRQLLLPDEPLDSDTGDDGQDFDDVSLWDEYVLPVRGGVAYGDVS